MILVRKIRREGDVTAVDLSDRHGVRFTAHVFHVTHPEPPPGTFLAGSLNRGPEPTVYYMAPLYLMADNGAILDMKASQHSAWFRQMMGRIIFAK